ncbi:hypothetical protein FB451DRAFT_1392607 [Mycena latifolia]|nr:hypothetical protein FB451DRAFT_1392607 [Mycena latifolia]
MLLGWRGQFFPFGFGLVREQPGGDNYKEKGVVFERAVDPSEEAAAAKLWAVSISEAEKYDKSLVESWKSDMEGMLILAGLFSASFTAFIVESYKTLTRTLGTPQCSY